MLALSKFLMLGYLAFAIGDNHLPMYLKSCVG